jgi:hypothetical protein
VKQRSPLKRSSVPLRRLTPLRKVSPKTRARNARFAAETRPAVFARDRYTCYAAELVPQVACAGVLDPHHLAPRSTRPDLVCAFDNVVSVCRAHHCWIDAEPRAARAVGLHRYSWDVA